MPLYIEKMEIWSGVTDLQQTQDSLTDFEDRATELLRHGSGVLVIQLLSCRNGHTQLE